MSLKSVVQGLKAGDVALFPPRERKHATTSLQHATTDATTDATNNSNRAKLLVSVCNTACNNDATSTKKLCNKPGALGASFVASQIESRLCVWNFRVDGKCVTAIDADRMSEEDFAAYLEIKFGAGRVIDLQLMRK